MTPNYPDFISFGLPASHPAENIDGPKSLSPIDDVGYLVQQLRLFRVRQKAFENRFLSAGRISSQYAQCLSQASVARNIVSCQIKLPFSHGKNLYGK